MLFQIKCNHPFFSSFVAGKDYRHLFWFYHQKQSDFVPHCAWKHLKTPNVSGLGLGGGFSCRGGRPMQMTPGVTSQQELKRNNLHSTVSPLWAAKRRLLLSSLCQLVVSGTTSLFRREKQVFHKMRTFSIEDRNGSVFFSAIISYYFSSYSLSS